MRQATMATYDEDLYTWTMEQAQLLREGRLSELDIENIAEELEDIGKSQARTLGSQLERLIAHLLKWCYQLNQRQQLEHSWRASIRNARQEIEETLSENPGLKPRLTEFFRKAYPKGVNWAVIETNLPESTFPTECPWTLEQVLNPDFWPQ
jgi:hypothetical protein